MTDLAFSEGPLRLDLEVPIPVSGRAYVGARVRIGPDSTVTITCDGAVVAVERIGPVDGWHAVAPEALVTGEPGSTVRCHLSVTGTWCDPVAPSLGGFPILAAATEPLRGHRPGAPTDRST